MERSFRYNQLQSPHAQIEESFSSAEDSISSCSQEQRSDRIKELQEMLIELDKRMKDSQGLLSHLEDLKEGHTRPMREQLLQLHMQQEDVEVKRQIAMTPRPQPPPGPNVLKWVSSVWFTAICNIVVAINLVVMFTFNDDEDNLGRDVFDNVVLVWYLVELVLNITYYQRMYLFGKCGVVVWNWLDVFIVTSGVIEGWVLPWLSSHNSLPIKLTALRFLRIFRVLRILRLLKTFLNSNMTWCETPQFDLFIALIIGLNSAVMAWELDIDWSGWVYVENIFLIIYSFELAVKLKRFGCHFFRDRSNLFWNYADCTMVIGGVIELWVLPLASTVMLLVSGETHNFSKSLSGAIKILRMFRLLRVLRLVKLVRTIRPLYNLLMGTFESLKAMQWFMLLVAISIYGWGITWTLLIGRDMLPLPDDEELRAQAHKSFGSVPKAMFSLFKLMNADTSVVTATTYTYQGKLLSVCFIILSNWALLAILTSVVSDNMIRSSAKADQEYANEKAEVAKEKRLASLNAVFNKLDKDGDKLIDKDEWKRLMHDDVMRNELCDATDLSRKSLQDAFDCASRQHFTEEGNGAGSFASKTAAVRELTYDDFIKMLEDVSTDADRRSVRNVMLHLKGIESMICRIRADVADARHS